jgi:hypothetical protein
VIADEVRAELEILDATRTSPGLAAVAIRLAAALDAVESGDSLTSQASVARELATILARLRTQSTSTSKGGALDELTGRREERLKQQARAAGDG